MPVGSLSCIPICVAVFSSLVVCTPEMNLVSSPFWLDFYIVSLFFLLVQSPCFIMFEVKFQVCPFQNGHVQGEIPVSPLHLWLFTIDNHLYRWFLYHWGGRNHGFYHGFTQHPPTSAVRKSRHRPGVATKTSGQRPKSGAASMGVCCCAATPPKMTPPKQLRCLGREKIRCLQRKYPVVMVIPMKNHVEPHPLIHHESTMIPLGWWHSQYDGKNKPK